MWYTSTNTMIVASIILKMTLIASFVLCGLYMAGTGALFSPLGLLGWVGLSLLVWITVSIILSPILIVIGLIGLLVGI